MSGPSTMCCGRWVHSAAATEVPCRAAYASWLSESLAETGTPSAERRVGFTAMHQGGRRLPVELSLTVLRRSGDMAAYMFVRDVTAVRRSEMLRGLEYSVAGALGSRLTPDGAVEMVYSSPNTAAVFGGPPPPGMDLATALMTMVHPDDSEVLAAFYETMTLGQPAQAECRRADSEERMRTQFSPATVGQAIIGLDGSLQQVNPACADMLGRPVGELERMTLDAITHPDDLAGNHRGAARLFAENEPIDRALRLVHADGRIVDAAVGMSLLRDPGGQPVSFIAVIQDVTARLAAERDRDT